MNQTNTSTQLFANETGFMASISRNAILTVVIIGLLGSGSAWSRGFGGFHGGGGGLGGGRLGGGGFGGGGLGATMGGMRGMAGPSMGARNFGGGMPGGMNPGALRGGGGGALEGLGGGRLGGLGSGALRSGELGGGEGLNALRSELGSGSGAGLQALESRLGEGGGSLAGRLPQLGQGTLPGLNRSAGNGPLAGKVPSDGQLSKFLGIPSDKGLHNLSGETQSRASQLYDKARSGDGDLKNRIDGETQSRLSQLYDKAKDGDGDLRNRIDGETQSRLSQLYDKAKDGDGDLKNRISGETQKPLSKLYDDIRAGDRPFQNFIPGETQKPLSRLYDRIRTNGNHPLRPWSPWWIHNNAIIIRRNFNAYFFFTPAWYAAYPAAWYPPVWYYGDPWVWAPWPTVANWCGYPTQPVYYDYGNNVVYQDNSVTVNGNNMGTPAQYAQQAQQLAEQGSEAPADEKQWMSLGVFAVSQGQQDKSNMVMQLAINKEGIIRGNYSNSATKDTQVIHGKVDKKTLRAAWTIGDKDNIVMDTGIYNLTKDETSVLVHFGDGDTKQWLMVRIKQKDDPKSANSAQTSAQTSN